MTFENTAGTVVRWWRGHRPLTLGLAAVATVLAFVVGFALIPHPETFRTAPDLVARLGELGSPCTGYVSQANDDTFGLCRADGHSFVILTDSAAVERDVSEWKARPYELDGDFVAVGDGWYLYGHRDYVSHVAALFDADLIS